jgi:hypothetical protein
MRVTRRRFLQGVSMSGAAIRVGLPPLAAWFTNNGTAYAAARGAQAITPRFVFWFNGNGIPERYWIPSTLGPDYEFTPCLAPLASLKRDIHVISSIDNAGARAATTGNPHHRSISGLVCGAPYTGRGAGYASIDQVSAGGLVGKTPFNSLQVGVCLESHGENIHRNMSWAGPDRALPPELIPQNLFDRLFGVRDESWVGRKKSVLDAVREDLGALKPTLSQPDRDRLDEHLTAVRDLERAVASLPSDYGRNVKEPEDVSDLTDYPRIAKIQSDLVVHALASGQTNVASYMLSKGQSLTRFPWLGYTRLRHHDYTHRNASSPESQRIMRDICRWHVEEFAYFLNKLKSVPEGDGNLLDNTCVLFAHEHAEANPHKNNGLSMILAGHAGGMKTGLHSRMRNTNGDLYLTIAEEIFKQRLEKGLPSAESKVTGIV